MTTVLEDVEVEKLGLVTAGANGETFFIMKSADAADPLEQVTETLWARFKRVIKGALNDEEATVAKVDEVIEEPAPVTEVAKVCATDDEEKDEEASVAKTVADDGVNTMSEETVAKSAYDALMGKLDALQERVVKAEADAEAARDTRQREERIAKARNLSALPVNPIELGENLHKLAKADPALATYFDAVIKTADDMLSGLGIFEERGSTQANALIDPVIKAAQSTDPRAALLSLDRKAAAQYIAHQQALVRKAS